MKRPSGDGYTQSSATGTRRSRLSAFGSTSTRGGPSGDSRTTSTGWSASSDSTTSWNQRPRFGVGGVTRVSTVSASMRSRSGSKPGQSRMCASAAAFCAVGQASISSLSSSSHRYGSSKLTPPIVSLIASRRAAPSPCMRRHPLELIVVARGFPGPSTTDQRSPGTLRRSSGRRRGRTPVGSQQILRGRRVMPSHRVGVAWTIVARAAKAGAEISPAWANAA